MLRFLKRQVWVLSIFSVAFLVLAGRLIYIQLIGTESFSKHNVNLIKKSIQQRQQQFVLHSGRGEITDRFGQSLTGMSTHVLALFPLLQHSNISDHELERVASVIHVESGELREQIENLREPQLFSNPNGIVHLTEEEADQVNELNIQGILGLPYELRYDSENMLSQHLIGYIGQNSDYLRKYYAQELAQGILHENSQIGITGLEKSFQPFLQGLGPVALSYYVDARGVPLAGLDIRYTNQENTFYPLIVRSTLDKELQETVERIMDRNAVYEGAVVVLDNETSEVLAMSSRPNFLHQLSTTNAWENKVLKRYAPGSVFKIVVAAAALESDIVSPQRMFQCDGVVEGTHFHCWKKEGHGLLSFEEGFAQSCNVVFGQLAQELGPEKLEEYAHKLGLLEPNVWRTSSLFHYQNFSQLDGEEIGQVYSLARTKEERNDKQYLLHTGIGQLDVQVTPLSVANMLATISKGGHKHQVKVVGDILYQTGASFYHFGKNKMQQDSITPYTAYQLQKLMAKVVESGTAQALKGREWTAGGKTGTAQVKGIDQLLPAAEKNHLWFAGYYPQHNAKYSIVVLALNQQLNTRNISVDLFAEIVDWLDNNR